MKNLIYFAFLAFVFSTCQSETAENHHAEPTHNFTVKRLLIFNNQKEVLMVKEADHWYSPSMLYNDRQFVKEGLDSLANTFGIQIQSPKLRAYLSYKYEYHPYSTLRAYYMADYANGAVKTPPKMQDAKWMPIAEAIEKTPVQSMKDITTQIMEYPDTLWGGSYEVFRIGEEHQARMVEEFYPLGY